jgi:hypothetical protein
LSTATLRHIRLFDKTKVLHVELHLLEFLGFALQFCLLFCNPLSCWRTSNLNQQLGLEPSIRDLEFFLNLLEAESVFDQGPH